MKRERRKSSSLERKIYICPALLWRNINKATAVLPTYTILQLSHVWCYQRPAFVSSKIFKVSSMHRGGITRYNSSLQVSLKPSTTLFTNLEKCSRNFNLGVKDLGTMLQFWAAPNPDTNFEISFAFATIFHKDGEGVYLFRTVLLRRVKFLKSSFFLYSWSRKPEAKPPPQTSKDRS